MRPEQLRVGMRVDLCGQRKFDFRSVADVEAVGRDWAIVRDASGGVWLLEPNDHVEIWDTGKRRDDDGEVLP